MSLEKRFLRSRAAHVLMGTLIRPYRTLMYGGFLYEHDAKLVALLRSDEPVIFACWHQDFVHTLGYLSRFNVRRPTHVLASASRDGGLATAAALGAGFRGAVRGSSARGGAAALRGLHRLAAERRTSFAVVCDGPRPPARVLKPGVLHLARATGLPVWLVRTSYTPATVLTKSWARFVQPKPWARAVCLADGPILVPADLERRGLMALRQDVEGRLNALADRADRRVGTAPGSGDPPRK